MANKVSKQARVDAKAGPAADTREKSQAGSFLVFRETLESIVVAFVLAFLFRTFEAEAFVIPTGSMSPSLQGQHKDVECTHCGYSFRTTASSEGENRDKMMTEQKFLTKELKRREAELKRYVEKFGRNDPGTVQREYERNVFGGRFQANAQRIEALEVLGGMCPMCRYLMPMRPDLPENVRDEVSASEIDVQPSYPGDRILVNKYRFDFSEPERWDVIVFKFPGDGEMNYIKRLTGLPGEVVRLYQGDLFTKPLDAPDDEFRIERKPPDKVTAMLHEVHNTDYEATTLYEAGWPLRWAATTPDGWKVDAKPGEKTVEQRFSVDAKEGAADAWLRYRHLIPSEGDWRIAQAFPDDRKFDELKRKEGEPDLTRDEVRKSWREDIPPQLINDFNAYNARLTRLYAVQDGWQVSAFPHGQDSGSLGTEWVSDLGVKCDVEIEESRGELVLDLVEAGYHFHATINLQDGVAKFSIIDGRTGQRVEGFEATRKTGITTPGEYEIRFANVDDQLLLWIDGELVEEGAAAYDPDELFEGGRERMIPWASASQDEDQGDLAPVGVGARGAKLSVTQLSVLRDIYYIAVKYGQDGNYAIDYAQPTVPFSQLFSDPSAWEHFATRQKRNFPVEEGQLLVLGDNSPESKDCRLWVWGDEHSGIPGGPYLDRKLLIGKAVCVFWPHSWGEIPGLRKLPGWPNFGDMRLVR